MKHSYKQIFRISSFDLDPDGKVRLTSLANFFQEVAYQHAGQLGFGYQDLKDNDTFWVLSRMRIRVERYPLWDEEIEVETWPDGVEKIFAMRDFRIKDKDGKSIAIASTAWLIINSTTRRPVRVTDVFHEFLDKVDSVFDRPIEKITLPAEMTLSENRMVKHSDLDIVNHVNNVKYIEWSLDQLTEKEIKENPVMEVEINFMNESRVGDEVKIMINRSDKGTFYISGTRSSDNKEIYRTILRINNQ